MSLIPAVLDPICEPKRQRSNRRKVAANAYSASNIGFFDRPAVTTMIELLRVLKRRNEKGNILKTSHCKTLLFVFALLVQFVFLAHTSAAQDDASCLDFAQNISRFYEQVEAEVPRVGLRGDGLLEVWRSFYPTPYWPGSGCDDGIGVVDPATHLFQNGINGGFTRESISLSLLSTPAVVTKSDGTVSFFGEWLNDNGTRSIARFGDVFENLSGQLFSEPSAAVNQDGRMEVFAVGFSGVIWHIWQTTPNGGWSSWQSMGAQVIKDGTYGYIHPVVVRNADGRLELFIWGLDKAIWHAAQTCAGCGWGSWSTLFQANCNLFLR